MNKIGARNLLFYLLIYWNQSDHLISRETGVCAVACGAEWVASFLELVASSSGLKAPCTSLLFPRQEDDQGCDHTVVVASLP